MLQGVSLTSIELRSQVLVCMEIKNQITTTSCAPFTNGKDLTNNQITTIVDGGNTIIFETADGSSVSMSGTTFEDGVPHGSSYLAPVSKVQPSGPMNVKLSIVSTNSLGVSWNAPQKMVATQLQNILSSGTVTTRFLGLRRVRTGHMLLVLLPKIPLNTKLQTAYINTKLER